MTRREFMQNRTVTIRILFYKSKFGDGHILDNLISGYTGLFNWGTKNYSHCEIWLPCDQKWHGEKNRFCNPVRATRCLEPHDYYGTCFTSTMRGENNGVVKRPASQVLKNPGRWDYYEIEVDEGTYREIMEWMNERVDRNKGYDKKAILRFFSPFYFHDVDRYICSEFVKNALCNWFFWGYNIDSPRRLSARLNKMGLKAKGVA